MSKESKVDLTLLKKFVSELENGLLAADTARASESDMVEYLVELAKANGIAAAVMQEAAMLVGDIQNQMMKIQNPTSSKNDLIEKLLGSAKGGPLGGSGFGTGGFGSGGFGGSGN